MSYTLEFESRLVASPEELWRWMVSPEGIRRELWPLIRMGTPRGVRSLEDMEISPGKPLFRSIIWLGGVLPMDYSHVTLLEMEHERGFLEQSPMGSMKKWRHERRIHPVEGGCVLTDRIEFEPRMARKLVSWFTRQLFRNRHRVLREEFGELAEPLKTPHESPGP